jgi:hypothetical protein
VDVGGTFTTMNFAGADKTVASDISNSGDIVGFYRLNGINFGFLDKGGSFSTIAFPGAIGTEVYGINDQRDLVGAYAHQSAVVHGFEAIPVSEPGPFGLLMGALLAAVAWQLRRSVSAARGQLRSITIKLLSL